MKATRFLLLISLTAIGFAPLLTSPARAESEIEMMRREMRELKKTVNDLTQTVKQQNRRIDELSGKPPTEAKVQTTKEEVPVIAKPESEPIAAPTLKPTSQEVGSLTKTPETAPSAPASYKSIGFWKVPTGTSAAWKLIPDISATTDFAGAYFSREPTGDVGHDPARTGFTFQEVEIAFQSVIDPYFRYDIFLSFHEDGVELEEAYFTTLTPPRGLQFRGGKFFIPFGRQNPKHLHNWDFADNMLVNKYLLGPEGLNELGLEISYLFPTPFFLQLQGTFSNGANETSFGGNRKQDFLYQGRLATSVDITDNLTALIGASAATGFNSTGTGNKTDLFGGDFYLRWKPNAFTGLAWQTEYIVRRMQVPGDNFVDGGLYSYVDYQFYKRWHAGFRYDQMGIPQGLIPSEFRLTPALTFDPTEFSRIRLQYEYDKIRNLSGDHAAILQFQFTMGPHGAHPF